MAARLFLMFKIQWLTGERAFKRVEWFVFTLVPGSAARVDGPFQRYRRSDWYLAWNALLKTIWKDRKWKDSILRGRPEKIRPIIAPGALLQPPQRLQRLIICSLYFKKNKTTQELSGKLTNRLKRMAKNGKKNTTTQFLFLVVLQVDSKESKTWSRFLDLLEVTCLYNQCVEQSYSLFSLGQNCFGINSYC